MNDDSIAGRVVALALIYEQMFVIPYEQGGAVVKVTNRNWLSMEIYVLGQSRRVRLGRVSAGQSKQFTIPAHLLTGATPLRFEMESSGAQRDVFSEAFVVAPGEEVVLVIPNTR